MPTRNAWLDQVKGIACLLIVCHHLAFYGPMSTVVQPVVPVVMDWLYEYGRMAVQVFLVMGGYFAAAGLAPQGTAKHANLGPLLVKRYVRLVIPYAAALVVTMVVTELVRNWGFEHASMSSPAQWVQVLAHLLLVHGIGGWESLSAGVWYVAMDFQLYAVIACVFVIYQKWFARDPEAGDKAGRLAGIATVPQIVVVALAAASLWGWNLDGDLDNWALYFLGAYGMGAMAWWASHAEKTQQRWVWALCIAFLGALALYIEWRTRIALAWVSALVLALAGSVRWPAVVQKFCWPPLQRLGQQSYSVFLIHFSMSLLVNALCTLWWPESIAMNALGLLVAVLLSVAAARVLYRYVESQKASWREFLRWQAGTFGVLAVIAIKLL